MRLYSVLVVLFSTSALSRLVDGRQTRSSSLELDDDGKNWINEAVNTLLSPRKSSKDSSFEFSLIDDNDDSDNNDSSDNDNDSDADNDNDNEDDSGKDSGGIEDLIKQARRLSFEPSGVDLENWMTNLPKKTKSCFPINTLAIPGSHDSFTRMMNAQSRAAPGYNNYSIIYVLDALGPVVGDLMVNWLRTQRYTPTQQLMTGIRYFDLRFATKTGSQDLWFVHGLYTEIILSVFNELLEFLDRHPKEVIILDCQEFYALEESHHRRLIGILNKYFGSRAVPYTDISTLTLSYLTEQNNYQVIIIYREDNFIGVAPFLWHQRTFPNSWLSTMSQNELFTNMDKDILLRNSSTALISISIITPDTKFIIRHIRSTHEKKCQMPLQEPMLEWISRQKPGAGGFNIIITNFVDLDDDAFSKAVVDLNSMLYYDDCLV